MGEVKLFIYRARQLEVDGQPGFMLLIEEAPKSR